jgi:hypothetical protein
MGGFCRGDSFFFLTNVYLNVFGRVLLMCVHTHSIRARLVMSLVSIYGFKVSAFKGVVKK